MLFFNKEKSEICSEQYMCMQESASRALSPIPLLKREYIHTQSIIGGRLYSTEKSTKICGTKDHRVLFVTPKGNYFSCNYTNDDYIQQEENGTYRVSAIIYSDIRPETEQYARENIGMYDVEKYIELFGEVEEA